MKHLLMTHRLAYLLKQRNSGFALIVFLLFLNLVQSFYTLFKSERIVIVPPDVRQEFWVTKGAVSKSYLEEMAIFYADILLEVSPNGAAYRRDIILRNASAKGFGALKLKLLEEEKRLKKERVSTSFQPNHVTVDPKNLAVEIKGDLMRYIGGKRISQSRDTYRFVFSYKRGRLLIESFKLIWSSKNED